MNLRMSLRQMLLGWWRPESSLGPTLGFDREQLLAVCMLMIGANALLFYFLPQSDYDHRANLLTVAVMLAMLPFALLRRLHFWMVNGALLVAMSLVVYIATTNAVMANL